MIFPQDRPMICLIRVSITFFERKNCRIRLAVYAVIARVKEFIIKYLTNGHIYVIIRLR